MQLEPFASAGHATVFSCHRGQYRSLFLILPQVLNILQSRYILRQSESSSRAVPSGAVPSGA